MRSLLSLSLALAMRLCAAGPVPRLQYDPNTISSCVEWYDNLKDMTCEETRDYFGITPEEFTEWNPSVSLDCEPWDFQSYCIVTQERLDNSTTPSPTTSEAESTPTTTTVDLGPSPTAWVELGCYTDDNPDVPSLETRVSVEGGDEALTIEKCKNACYLAAQRFAGLKAGNECWCSGFVAGFLADDEKECDTPCTGDKEQICGGKDRVSVFDSVDGDDDDDRPEKPSTTTTTESGEPQPTGGEPSTAPTEPNESGASRNFALF